MEKDCILAIDQGTTSTRAMLVAAEGSPRASHAVELRQIYPANGWVEHDPLEIWQATLACCKAIAGDASNIAAIGITNQRETTILWERSTGRPVAPAIVWQDRRTAPLCDELRAAGKAE
ncbi:MAG TPA: FGGY family carbohydrate kinase, partial [Rhizomicrobium sp.]|nr:FGGY family carbohydrate kinase [Rhizomicrobium sp.]